MFYKYNMVEARREAAERHILACKVAPIHSTKYIAEFGILYLQDIAKRGLPDCYESFDDFLCDFCTDFSWTPKDRDEQLRGVLADSRFPAIVVGIQDMFGFDMKEELDKVLRGED